MRRITSRSPIFDTTNIHRSAVGIVLKNDDFRDATPPAFAAAVDIFGITFGRKNIQILNCHGIFGHLSDIFRPWKATIPWAIKYLNIFRNKK